MKGFRKSTWAIILILCLWGTTVFAATVDDVVFNGNKRIPRARIESLLVQPGSEFDPAAINKSIHDLFDTGYFSEVLVDAAIVSNKFTITYMVMEMPIINSVYYEGNEEIQSELDNIISTNPGEPLNNVLIGYTIKNIKDAYEKRGYYDVEVTHEVLYRDNGADILYKIKEGDVSRAYNIWFDGNGVFTDEELREVINTKQKDFWSFVNSSGHVERSMLEYDRELLIDYYNENGYITMQVGEPEILFQDDRNRLNYIIRVNEGEQHTLATLTITDTDNTFSQEDYDNKLNLKEGEVFKLSSVRQSYSDIVHMFKELGYARVVVDQQITYGEAENTMDVTYTIKRGNIFNVNRIVIEGNTVSRDNVVRREIDVNEGEQYDITPIDEAKANLMSTGYFDNVDIVERFISDNETDLVVRVADKERLGQFMFGMGYSTYDDVSIMAEVAKDNLFGTGIKASISAEISSMKQDYVLGVSEPWLFDRPIMVGGELFSRTYEYTDYDRESVGGSLTFGHHIIKRRLMMDYTFLHETVDISDIDTDASKYVWAQKGKMVTNSITPAINYVKLDNNMDPTDGIRLRAAVEYAGTFLGGDGHFVELNLSGSYYKPLGRSFVGMVHVEGGQIWKLRDNPIPIDRRYRLGGIYSVRGYEQRTISPVDSDGEYYGGDKYYQANLEVWRPIVNGNINIRGVAFFDMGNVSNDGESFFEESPKMSIGAGMRFYTPIGILRLEYGYKLNREDDESAGEVEFTIGSSF